MTLNDNVLTFLKNNLYWLVEFIVNSAQKGSDNMKSGISIFEDYAKIDGFLTEIVKELEKNNPNLAKLIINTMELEKENAAKDRVFEAMLLASEIMGLTDPDDPDFVEISPNAATKTKRSTLTEVPTRYFTQLMPIIYEYNKKINDKEFSENLPKIPFSHVWSKVLKIAIAASSTKKLD